MPLDPNVHYAVTTTKSGKKIRLAFKGGSRKSRTGRVVEAKNLMTGATHSPAEFAQDRSPFARMHIRRMAGRRGR